MNEVRIPLSRGIAGHVATTGTSSVGISNEFRHFNYQVGQTDRQIIIFHVTRHQYSGTDWVMMSGHTVET